MTTKEEVMKLCDEAEFLSSEHFKRVYHKSVEGEIIPSNSQFKLIELAKAQGAEEERNKYNDFIERLRQMPMVEPASADAELNDLVEMFNAIRNRGQND